MAHDAIRNSTLTRTLADVIGDFSELFQKEMRLARAEVTEKVTNVVQASAWMVAAALLALLAILLVIEAIVFGLASLGLALHWSCLIVAAGLAICAAAAFAIGRSATKEPLVPAKSIRQISEDIRIAKEKLT
jgi:Putative Actinobacterial Holin-X, holin superfamily III